MEHPALVTLDPIVQVFGIFDVSCRPVCLLDDEVMNPIPDNVHHRFMENSSALRLRGSLCDPELFNDVEFALIAVSS
jgi:hypothetical protein